ncbi:putative universal stress protein UspA [Lunatimonas lonarensis]|jgi:nucleotide-binding universal stress UspA family protein|uniref:Putative universal stress protein UspA n=1 Tax=Lunatimonas lonarensis TaxID=1232681 RepID=R7ZQZ2_9BACT|nr:universal stress protein [Lunatimonas lonarensis]EON76535.1 putative universal stress protein UspA [Lunatimonas lonarensis]
MKILFPTDLSENAKNALDFAKKYAMLHDASITMLFAYYAVYDFAAQAEEIIAAIEEDANLALREVINSNTDPVYIDYKIVQGTVATAINATVLSGDFDLVIMGTQGASGIRKALIGSNTATVIKESQVPVIAVPTGATFESVKSVTVAVELSEEDEKLLKKVTDLTENWDLPYKVLHISNKDDFNKELSFKGLQVHLRETFPDDEFEFVKVSSPEFDAGAEKYLKDQKDTMMVMLSKNKTFFEFLFNKSQSVKFAYHTHVPLLVVK